MKKEITTSEMKWVLLCTKHMKCGLPKICTKKFDVKSVRMQRLFMQYLNTQTRWFAIHDLHNTVPTNWPTTRLSEKWKKIKIERNKNTQKMSFLQMKFVSIDFLIWFGLRKTKKISTRSLQIVFFFCKQIQKLILS